MTKIKIEKGRIMPMSIEVKAGSTTKRVRIDKNELYMMLACSGHHSIRDALQRHISDSNTLPNFSNHLDLETSFIKLETILFRFFYCDRVDKKYFSFLLCLCDAGR